MKKKYFIFCLTVVFSLTYSCSSEYDISNMDKDICIGGEEFVFPLGKSSKMVPDSLLNFSTIKELQKDSFGNYFFNYSGSLEQKLSFTSLASRMSLPKQTGSLEPVTGTLPILTDFQLSKLSFPYSYNLAIADKFAFSFDLSGAAKEGLRRLDSVEFTPSVIRISAKVECAGVASFPQMGLTSAMLLPSRFAISDPRAQGDTLVAFTSIPASGQISYEPVKFSRADFTDSPEVFTYADTIYFHSLRVDIPDAAAYKAVMGREINVRYSVLMEAEDGGLIAPKIAWCQVERKSDPINERIDITGIPEYMRDGVLDLVAPLLGLDLTTNATVPVKVDADINSFAGASAIGSASASIITDFTRTPSQTITSSYILANEDPGASDYTFVETDLRSVVKKVPDVIALTISPATYISGSSAQQVIYLTEDTDVDIDYNFSLPLAFGSELNMSFRDTITNMPEMLGDVLTKNDISIIGEATSTLPVDLTLQVNFLDKNGKSLDMFSSEAVIKGTASQGSPARGSYSLDVKKSSNAKDISKLELILALKNGQSDILTKDDYVQLTLQASVPGGIEIEIE